MPYEMRCPRCGADFSGDEPTAVADEVVGHARGKHAHSLDREVVLAHLAGRHPFDDGTDAPPARG